MAVAFGRILKVSSMYAPVSSRCMFQGRGSFFSIPFPPSMTLVFKSPCGDTPGEIPNIILPRYPVRIFAPPPPLPYLRVVTPTRKQACNSDCHDTVDPAWRARVQVSTTTDPLFNSRPMASSEAAMQGSSADLSMERSDAASGTALVSELPDMSGDTATDGTPTSNAKGSRPERGLSFWLVMAAICVSVFLSALEYVSIIPALLLLHPSVSIQIINIDLLHCADISLYCSSYHCS